MHIHVDHPPGRAFFLTFCVSLLWNAMAGPELETANGHANSHQDRDQDLLVIQAITKRLRNTKKRLRGIDEIQAKADAGKVLNQDQVG